MPTHKKKRGRVWSALLCFVIVFYETADYNRRHGNGAASPGIMPDALRCGGKQILTGEMRNAISL